MFQPENYKWCFLCVIVLSVSVIVLARSVTVSPQPITAPVQKVSTRIDWNTCTSPTNVFYYGTKSGVYTNSQLVSTTAKFTDPNFAIITNLTKDVMYYGVLKSVSKIETSGPSKEVKWVAGQTNVPIQQPRYVELSWTAKSNQWYYLSSKDIGQWRVFGTIKAHDTNMWYREGVDQHLTNKFYKLSSTNVVPKLQIKVTP